MQDFKQPWREAVEFIGCVVALQVSTSAKISLREFFPTALVGLLSCVGPHARTHNDNQIPAHTSVAHWHLSLRHILRVFKSFPRNHHCGYHMPGEVQDFAKCGSIALLYALCIQQHDIFLEVCSDSVHSFYLPILTSIYYDGYHR